MKIKSLQRGRESWILWLSVAICTLYQSYRYPLQINSTGTSPTYADTPFGLQAGKFILAAPLFAMSVYKFAHQKASLKSWLMALAALFIASSALFKLSGDPDARYLDVAFWMLFSMTLAGSVDSVKVSAIERYLKYLLIYALGSTAVVVFCFFAFGRLPALAYEGSYVIRFGGFWDDPNGFAAVLFLLLAWSYARFRGRRRFFILTAIVISMVITQSWTGLAFLLLISFLWMARIASRRPVLAALLICCGVLAAVLVTRYIALSPGEAVQQLLSDKQESIEGHIFPWDFWSIRWTRWIALGDSKYNAYESWWAAALVNYGVPWLCSCIALTLALIDSLRRGLANASREAKPVYWGLFIFGCYFAFGSLGLPLFTIFPVNFFFFLFAFLVAFGKMRLENDPPEFGPSAALPATMRTSAGSGGQPSAWKSA